MRAPGNLALLAVAFATIACTKPKFFNPIPDTPGAHVVTVTGVVPDQGSVGGGTAITISGTGFEPGATVLVGGVSCASVVQSSPSTLHCTTAAHAAGSADVVVNCPDGSTGSWSGDFQYRANTVYASQGGGVVTVGASVSALSGFSGSVDLVQTAPDLTAVSNVLYQP